MRPCSTFLYQFFFAQFHADYQQITTNRQNIFKTFRRKICLFKIFALSLHSQINGAIAQLVEQRTENPCVPGSIPGGTTQDGREFSPVFFCCSRVTSPRVYLVDSQQSRVAACCDLPGDGIFTTSSRSPQGATLLY